MKLKKKLSLFFTIITIIPLTCMTLFAYSQYVRIINRHIQTIAENQFDNLSMKVQDSYKSIRQTLSFLTFYSTDETSIISTLRRLNRMDSDISDYDKYLASENIKTAFQSAMYNQTYVEGIYVFTSDRMLLGHSHSWSDGISSSYDPADDEWYQETIALHGSLYISPVDVYPMFGTDSECFFVSHLIRDVDRNFEPLGVLVLEYSPDFFDLSQETALTDISLITLTNSANQSVIYTNREKCSLDITPTEQNSTVKPVFLTPFELSMTIDYDTLSSEYNTTLLLLLVLAVLCVICISLFLVQLTHSFINPIQELSGHMLQKPMTHADFSSVHENRSDEIGVLYRQYHTMIMELNSFIKTEYQNKLILLDSQMKALEARINSHFLFNTLESINSMAELADQEQISTMALALGHMFRYAIKTESELVTVRDELNHVLDYITIQSIRCDNPFSFVEDIPQELYDQKILKLIFQPIVENSLSHGLEYGNSGDKILLSVRMEQNLLQITLQDNGRGICPERLVTLQQQLHQEATFTELGHRTKESIGLKNIQSRIELYYGKGYGLTITSVEGEGTQIHIRVPVFPDSKEA